MKNTKIKGFSLAEVLISLTVVSILLAVAAPVITKQHVGDNTWKWTEGNTVKNGTSFDGDNLVIGSRTVPSVDDVDDYFSSFPDGDIKTAAASDLVLNNDRLISKLSVIKPTQRSGFIPSAFFDSHLSFYNIVSGDTEYAGRLASDKDNLAFGIASLQSLNPTQAVNNTAIGHYALAHNDTGRNNVALGYGALANTYNHTSNSVAVGYKALANNQRGQGDNTVIGNFLADSDNEIEEIQATQNLIIGNYDDISELTGYTKHTWGGPNIFIGNNAGRGLPVHKDAGLANNSPYFTSTIAIGNVNPTATDETGVELIQGSIYSDIGRKKKLIVNGDFIVRTADGSRALFKIDASGITIDPTNNVSLFEGRTDITNAPNGPDRCEGAEICIAKFKVPTVNDGAHKGYHEAYDVYVKGMINTNVARTSLLGTSLFILDRCKESMDAIMRVFSSLGKLSNGPTFIENLFGVSLAGNSFASFFESLFGISSDARLKNIYGDSTAGLNEINALKVKDYTYKADKTKTPHVGVIAQELQKVFPNSVIEGSDGYLSITQEEMFFGIVNSIQELSDKNDKISEKIALSKEQIEYTQKQNKLIEQENKLLERQNKEFAKRIAKLQKKDKK